MELNCLAIRSAEDLHTALAQTLALPEWYGHNLDALYDCLTDIDCPIHLTLAHFEDLGDWASGFRAVFHDACMENPLLTIETN